MFKMNGVGKPMKASDVASERTALQRVDYAPFFAALDHPPEPNKKLSAAFERYKATVVSR